MKTILAILSIAALVSYGYTVSCTATNYCMGCSSSTTNKCVSCFNWGSGSVGVRALNNSASPINCITAAPTAMKTSDTKIYSNAITTTGTTKSYNTSAICNKDFRNWTATGSTLACSNTKLSTVTSCAKISNCMSTTCFDSTTDTVTCEYCKKNYSGSSYDTTNSAGGTACASYSSISNCEYYYMSGSSTHSCVSCKSKYAASYGNASCTSFTTDSNCKSLQSGNTTCRQCWDAYYWNTSTCKLAGSILVTGLVAVMSFMM